MLTLNGYQHQTLATAVYPEAGPDHVGAIAYCSLGLAGEAGEIANKAKKLLRDHVTDELRDAMRAELGDVLYYVARLADELGFPLSVIAERNLDKLADRAARGAIHGSGDMR